MWWASEFTLIKITNSYRSPAHISSSFAKSSPARCRDALSLRANTATLFSKDGGARLFGWRMKDDVGTLCEAMPRALLILHFENNAILQDTSAIEFLLERAVDATLIRAFAPQKARMRQRSECKGGRVENRGPHLSPTALGRGSSPLLPATVCTTAPPLRTELVPCRVPPDC